MRRRVETLALRALADLDPEAASARAEGAMGRERDTLLAYVAESWIARDPDAALAWLESLDPPPRQALRAAVVALARVDFDRAVDLWLAPGADPALSPFGLPLAQHLDRLPALMDRLTALPRPARGMAALVARGPRDSTLATWAELDPEGALRWLVGRDTVDPDLVDIVATRFAARDAEAAAAAVYRVPEPLQSVWINSIAASYAARTDAAKALAWIAQFRGQPGYDDWVTTVVETAVGRDPEAAARLLALGDASVQRNTPYVAQQWASLDPVRAAEWAAALANAEQRSAATRIVAAQWTSADAAAARRWALGLAGPTRDTAVTAIIEAEIGTSRTIDRNLLDALSNAATRQRLVRVAVPNLARDTTQARVLIDAYITDPAERRAAHEELARARP
jgi:hypothetical protein